MKNPTMIRFALAIVYIAIVCLGLLFGIIGISAFLAGALYLFIRRSDLAKPVSAESIICGTILAGWVIFDISVFGKPITIFSTIDAAIIFTGLMIAVLYEWQSAKKNSALCPAPESIGDLKANRH